jgi:hypothetical protein
VLVTEGKGNNAMNGMGAIRKAAAGVALAVGLSIAAVGGAGAASADEDSYLTDLADNGFTGSVADALDWGYRICADWNAGLDQGTIVDNVFSGTDESIDYDDAQFIFESAVMYLC